MSSQGPIDPLQEVLADTKQILAELGNLHQELARVHDPALDALRQNVSGLKPEIASVRNSLTQLETRQQHDLQDIVNRSERVLTAIADLPQRPLTINPSSLVDLKTDMARLEPTIAGVKSDVAALSTRQSADVLNVSNLIREQKESKAWKIGSWAIPVVLTGVASLTIWYMQISTNQKIDEASKKLATRLSVTEAFQKRKLAVYEEADKQMAAIEGSLKDLSQNPGDSQQKKEAADNARKLTDMSKTNGIYMTDDVKTGLQDVAFTAARSPLLSGESGNNLEIIKGKIHHVEAQMKKEFRGFDTLD